MKSRRPHPQPQLGNRHKNAGNSSQSSCGSKVALNLEYRQGCRQHQHLSKELSKRAESSRTLSKHRNSPSCSSCQELKRKMQEREQQFRQLIAVHRQEVNALEAANQQLREELEGLEVRARSAEAEASRLRI
jgi:phage shock protein A